LLPRIVFRFLLTLLVLTLGLPHLATAQRFLPGTEFRADETVYDFATGVATAKGNVRLAYQGAVLEAEEMVYNDRLHQAVARGEVRVRHGARLMLASVAVYNLQEERFELTDLKFGQGKAYFTAARAEGTPARMTLTNAMFVYDKPGPFAPTLRAASLEFVEGEEIRAERVRIGIGMFQPFALPSFTRPLGGAPAKELTLNGGYRSTLGLHATIGYLLPIRANIRAGAELGLYSNRGVLIGPAATYSFGDDDRGGRGTLRSGYIHDNGDRFEDILGRPVPKDRGFVRWEHQQRLSPRTTLFGEVNYWSDSEVTRDFRSREFNRVQTPDSFLEAVYAADNYSLSLFSRLHPNRYHRVQQRLPELRFDLLPTPLAGGIHQRAQAGVALLREDDPFDEPTLRSDRYDAYYGLTRTFTPRDWFSFQALAGGRVTHYARALGGRDDYTRTLGELGFDAELRASGLYAYRNERWGIDGLRHLITPRLGYRYIPQGDRGRPYIPSIDRRAFTTYLEPFGLGDQRNIDDLRKTNTLRIGLDNTLQTRDPAYGSRDLVSFNLAADLRFDKQPGERDFSAVHAELRLTPAPWLEFDIYQSLDPYDGKLGELNTGLILNDGDVHAVRLGTHYLRGEIEEYVLDYRYRFNEVWQALTELHYDRRQDRFVERTFGIRQTIGNLWWVQYEASYFRGLRRESSFRFRIEIELATF
jgi:LPS-assembly protein